ncbi:MAG: hypothetical protein EOP45_20720 [Sphingobacteriaceae bacterium]|nr:MAG: hypothetical protein EOP45_20720 [Sphingobacteriaceae bacterium]
MKTKKSFFKVDTKALGIAANMLSKELQDLEINGLVTRTIINTIPIAS